MATKSSRQRGVYRRGNRWYVRIKHKGKDIRKSAGSYEEACHALHALKVQIMNDTFEKDFGVRRQKKAGPTFNAVADRFLQEYCSAPGKKPSLREFHENTLKALRRFFGNTRFNDITAWQIRKYKMERVKQQSKRGDGNISLTTCNRELATLKRMFAVAKKQWGIVEVNPAEDVEKYPEKLIRVDYLETWEIEALIDAAEPYFRPVLIVAVFTGLRRGEILGLTWNRVDFKRMEIRLDEGKTIVQEPEYVPMSPTVAETLLKLKGNDPVHVFLRDVGQGPLRDVRKPFQNALNRSGIAETRRRAGKPTLRFHDLRHTCASHAVMAGLGLEFAQKLLRHRNIKTTQRYAHLSPAYMQNQALALDEHLRSGTKGGTVVHINT